MNMCRICKRENCYVHCQKTEDGKHVADPTSAQTAKGMPFVIDFNCELCGISGSIKVEADDISWE